MLGELSVIDGSPICYHCVRVLDKDIIKDFFIYFVILQCKPKNE